MAGSPTSCQQVTDAVKGPRFPAPPPIPTFLPVVSQSTVDFCLCVLQRQRGWIEVMDRRLMRPRVYCGVSWVQAGVKYPSEITAPDSENDPLTPPEGTDD